VKSKSYVVAVNWSNISVTVDLGEFRDIPEAADIYVTSVNFSGGSSRAMYVPLTFRKVSEFQE
jgi:hypothetical protein